MSTTALIVLVVLVVLVAALVAWALTMTRNRKRTVVATELRTDAVRQSSDVDQAKGDLAAREMAADDARARADVAEQEAEAARRELAQTEATREDVLRTADRVDPKVDHRSDDYTPGDVPATDRPV